MQKFITKKINLLIPLLIMGFSFFVAYNNVGVGIINYIDHNFPFYFSDHLNRLSFVWNDNIYLGSNQATNLVNGLSYYSLFYFFEKIGLNYILINRLEHAISIFCIIYFTYLFLQSLSRNKVNISHKLLLILASTFFLTNISTMGLLTMGLTQAVLSMSGIPLVLYSLRKFGLSHKKLFLFPMIVGSLIITSFNLPYNVISMIAVLLLALLFNDINFKLKIKNIFIFLLIWFFVNSYWIFPMFYSIFIAPSANLTDTLKSMSVLKDVFQLTATRYTLDRLLTLGINLDLVKIQNNDTSVILNYFANKWFLFLSYFTIIGLFLWFFILKKRKNRIAFHPLSLVSVFLLFTFLAKGLSQPFGGFNFYLFDNTIFFKMFRDSLKWMTIPFLVIIVLMSNIFLDNSKKWLKLIVVLFLLFNLFPWTYNGLLGRLRAYNVPNYYFALNDYYKNTANRSNKRAVILDSEVGATSFEFDVKTKERMSLSNNILKFISPFPPVDLFSNGGGISFDYIKNVFDNLKKVNKDLVAFQKLGATHIYHQRDLTNPTDYNYTYKYFNKNTFGKIDVYEIKKEYILPKVFLSNTSENTKLRFFKINPTKYTLSIKNIRDKLNLNFLYTIDRNWMLYLKQNPINFQCDLYENYKNVKTTECLNKPSFFEGEEFSFLWKKSSFNNTQHLFNGYANSWTIDSKYIKSNFSKQYYTNNYDGSIDIELTLYFKPQSWFYLGLIISGLTLFGCLSYLVIYFVRSRKTKHPKHPKPLPQASTS